MSQEHKPWDTYRTKCGNGRITYHPEWSPEKPWASYWRGLAGLHFATVSEADMYFLRAHNTELRLSR